MRTICIFCLILLITLLCTACGTHRARIPAQQYGGASNEPTQPRVIAVFPIEPGPAPQESAELLTRTLVSVLSTRYEVAQVELPPAGLVEPEKRILIDDLLLARDKFRADAVLMGKIIDYRRRDPPSLTMSLKFISTEDAKLLWAASRTIDSAQPNIEERVRTYFAEVQESNRSLFGWRTVLLAERRYIQFVANEFLRTMDPHWRP